MDNTKFHPCPICFNSVTHAARYPRAVCRVCYDQASDAQGRKLSFFNLSGGGGFGALVADTKEKYPSHICYIEGIKCWADEARFGGIVIQPHDHEPFECD